MNASDTASATANTSASAPSRAILRQAANSTTPWWQDKTPTRKLVKYRPLKDGSLFFRFVVAVLRKFAQLKVLHVEEGIEKIPYEGSAIVIAPHLGGFDAIIAPEFVTRAGRMPRIMAKASLWKIPVVKQAFNSGKLIPVERGTVNASKSLEGAIKALADGDVVFIFPEGTLSKDPESWPMTTKTGAARLALISGAPVIPILQDGSQFLRKKPKQTKKGRVIPASSRDVPWFNSHNKGGKVVMHVKGYDPIDFSSVFSSAEPNPSPEQIEAVNKIIEDTLTGIVSENRRVLAPPRFDAKEGRRI